MSKCNNIKCVDSTIVTMIDALSNATVSVLNDMNIDINVADTGEETLMNIVQTNGYLPIMCAYLDIDIDNKSKAMQLSKLLKDNTMHISHDDEIIDLLIHFRELQPYSLFVDQIYIELGYNIDPSAECKKLVDTIVEHLGDENTDLFTELNDYFNSDDNPEFSYEWIGKLMNISMVESNNCICDTINLLVKTMLENIY